MLAFDWCPNIVKISICIVITDELLFTYPFRPLIQPRRLQQLLPYLVGQPLRLQDFDVRTSGEQRCVKVVGYPQPVFKVGPVLA